MLHKHQVLGSSQEQGGADSKLVSSHMTSLKLKYGVPFKKLHDNKIF